MNKNIKAEVHTPHGVTKEFHIEEAVRQGTIYGTILCGISINCLNKMGQPDPLILHKKLEIECPIYVDDIVGMGSNKQIERIGEKIEWTGSHKKV